MIKDDSMERPLNPNRTTNSTIDLNNIANVSLDEKDYQLFQSKKHKKFFNKSFRSLVILILYLTCTTLSIIFLKHRLPSPHPFFSAYTNTSLFVFFIPISFMVNLYLDVAKKQPQEEEKSSLEISKTMSDNFSDIMEKKFYENYYRYYRSFYFNAIVLMLLYFLSLSFYFISLGTLSPFICSVINSFTSLFVFIPILFTRGIRCSLTKALLLSMNVIILSLFIVSIVFLNNNQNSSISIMLSHCSISGFICCFVSSIFNALFIVYYKKLIKKYKFYIDISELVGYIGLFSLLLIPLLLVALHYMTFETFSFPKGYMALQYILKGGLESFVTDYLLMRALRFFNISTFSSVYGFNLGILILCFYINIWSEIKNNVISLYTFIGGEVVVVALAVLGFFHHKISRKKRKIKGKRRHKCV